MQVVEAVADPVRRRILELLLTGEAPAGVIAEAFPVSRPAISRHLRVLREAGLVQVRVVGQQRVYRLDASPLAVVDDWLAQFRPLPVTTSGDRAGDRRVPGPAGRLDALDTEMRRGHRARAHEGRPDERDHEHDAAAG